MNSFSKVLRSAAFISAFMISLPSAFALDVVSLYTAACRSETGAIADVNPRTITLIDVSGQVKRIPRYDVIYFASYPFDVVPISKIVTSSSLPALSVRTRQGGSLVELVRGWPVDFTEDRIAFLTIDGAGVVVDRSSIWQLETIYLDRETRPATSLNRRSPERYKLVPPYPFSTCAPVTFGTGDSASVLRTVNPQQLLSDPVTIKREFDRLVAGHEQVEGYMRKQKFYAVPQVYGHDSSLGLWTTFGSRYGASSNRSNNFTPYLTDERGTGPFSFQQRVLTGSGPLVDGVHEEPQTQISYLIKSSYFRFTAMVDPSTFLVGSKYNWRKEDMTASSDDRISQVGQLTMGFDYGAWSLTLVPLTATKVGVTANNEFEKSDIALPGAGLRWVRPDYSVALLFGIGKSAGLDLSFTRLDGHWTINPKLSTDFIYIQRKLTADATSLVKGYTGESSTFSNYSLYHLNRRVNLGSFVSAEKQNTVSASAAGTSKLHLKGGVYGALVF